MAGDRRLRASLAGWGLLLTMPLFILFWLLLHPELDPILEIPVQHFYIVTAVQLVSLAVALLVARAAVEMREFRVLFLALGFMAMSGLFAVHALSTPGVLMESDEEYTGVAGLSAFLSLLTAALFFAASASRLPALIRPRTRAMAMALVGLVLAAVLAYGVTAFVWSEELEMVPITFPWGSFLTAGVIILLLAFAMKRSLSAYAVARLPMQWGLVAGFVLLAEAQVSMALSPAWSLAWWEYHFLMLLGSGSAMAGLVVQYGKAGSLRSIMEGVFELESLVQVELSHGETIAALAAATEAKDPYTKGHTVRVAEKAVALGQALHLPKDKLRVLARAGLLHDIGKLGTPDSILLKPGPLTPEEFQVIKEHPLLGLEILRRVGSMEREIVAIRSHHERMDGAGYPDGLSGDEIPVEARVLAVADVCDSLSFDRPYRKALPADRVREILLEEAGAHLDPRVVELCLPWCGSDCSLKELGRAATGTPAACSSAPT